MSDLDVEPDVDVPRIKKGFWRKVREASLIAGGAILVTCLVIGIIGVFVYLDWCAYHQRFPQAEFWTWFFNK